MKSLSAICAIIGLIAIVLAVVAKFVVLPIPGLPLIPPRGLLFFATAVLLLGINLTLLGGSKKE